jgi:LDH2 family malate/lactate/ureidoglycolate dehydrogenase
MPTFAADRLIRIGSDLFAAAGTPRDVADLVATSLVDSNLAGHDSHGVVRIPQYLGQIQSGDVLPAERPQIRRDGPTAIQVDGRWGFGQLSARFATELAVERAKQSQMAAVAIGRCNHVGRLGEWSELAAASGLLCLVTSCYGSGPYAAAPFGGAARALSTNPLSFAAPTGDGDRALVDFATTVVAEGKIRVARAKGTQLPPGAILDSQGRPSTNPEDYYAGGVLLPFAGHKGYGLAVMVELISVALGGADGLDSKRAAGTVILCIDPGAFRPADEYLETATRFKQRLLGVPPAQGFDRVLMPGDPEQNMRRERREQGIPVPDATWEAIGAAARERGVALD